MNFHFIDSSYTFLLKPYGRSNKLLLRVQLEPFFYRIAVSFLRYHISYCMMSFFVSLIFPLLPFRYIKKFIWRINRHVFVAHFWHNLSCNISYTRATSEKNSEPISCHWSLMIPPENIRKPLAFWCFQRVSKRSVAWNGLKRFAKIVHWKS